MNNKMIFAYGRTLISKNNDTPWLASVSNGSKIIEYTPTQEQIDVAIRSTQSIGAFINEVDMIQTHDGPIVIENNPTPNYGITSSKLGHTKDFIKMFLEEIK
jgi:glutathione synthase/RimK-type ligase-like ATP-grasp enzyme